MAREIEVKLLVDGLEYEHVVELAKQYLDEATAFRHGNSIDAYWRSPVNPNSFLRLRVSDDADITVKVDDKGTVQDRVEHTIPVAMKDKDAAMEALMAFAGDPSVVMYQWVDFAMKDGTVISVIRNIEKREWTFIEVEHKERIYVDSWVKWLNGKFEDLKVVKNSFRDIFVERQGVLL